MHGWLLISVAAAAASAGGVVLLLFLRRCCSSPKQGDDLGEEGSKATAQTLQTGIGKLHLHPHLDPETRRRTNYYMFKREPSSKPLFSWADHPSLVTDAVENGWSRFAFTTSYSASPSIRSTRSTLLGVCAAGERGREMVDISWEVCQGSSDFIQKIRINSSHSSCTIIKTGLPLPGPPLGSSSFPQEGYFEITILAPRREDHGNAKKIKSEGEKIKLIEENSSTEEVKHCGKDDGKGEGIALSIGLSRGGALPLKVPGSYAGSIGFNSDGSVYLDGMKLVFESEKQKWGETERVIGCGYNPNERKVLFTVDSELVHVISCKSEEFGSPLYPTLAANVDATVLVNFGQTVFKYGPANAQRTPNPCFIGPLVNSPALGYDDSRELFSMGRIDSQWLNRHARSGHNNGSANKAFDFDEESEGDLFEIVLDGGGNGR